MLNSCMRFGINECCTLGNLRLDSFETPSTAGKSVHCPVTGVVRLALTNAAAEVYCLASSFTYATGLSSQTKTSMVNHRNHEYGHIPSSWKGADVHTGLHYYIIMTICQPFIDDDWSNQLSPNILVSNSPRDSNVLMRLYYLRHSFAYTGV